MITNKKAPKGNQCQQWLPKFIGPYMIIDVLKKGALKLSIRESSTVINTPVNMRRVKPYKQFNHNSDNLPQMI